MGSISPKSTRNWEISSEKELKWIVHTWSKNVWTYKRLACGQCLCVSMKEFLKTDFQLNIQERRSMWLLNVYFMYRSKLPNLVFSDRTFSPNKAFTKGAHKKMDSLQKCPLRPLSPHTPSCYWTFILCDFMQFIFYMCIYIYMFLRQEKYFNISK